MPLNSLRTCHNVVVIVRMHQINSIWSQKTALILIGNFVTALSVDQNWRMGHESVLYGWVQSSWLQLHSKVVVFQSQVLCQLFVKTVGSIVYFSGVVMLWSERARPENNRDRGRGLQRPWRESIESPSNFKTVCGRCNYVLKKRWKLSCLRGCLRKHVHAHTHMHMCQRWHDC